MFIIVINDGAVTSTASFRIRGDIPSSPVALVASKEFKVLIKSECFSFGISKYTWLGNREFT